MAKKNDLASTAVGKGASQVGMADTDNNFASSNAEGALQELFYKTRYSFYDAYYWGQGGTRLFALINHEPTFDGTAIVKDFVIVPSSQHVAAGALFVTIGIVIDRGSWPITNPNFIHMVHVMGGAFRPKLYRYYNAVTNRVQILVEMNSDWPTVYSMNSLENTPLLSAVPDGAVEIIY